jgi:hypothetical protein
MAAARSGLASRQPIVATSRRWDRDTRSLEPPERPEALMER